MRHRWIAVAALFMTLSLQAQHKAQAPDEDGTTFTLQEEDDSLVSPSLHSDRGYTNGTRLLWSWTPAGESRLGTLASIVCRHQSEDECKRTVTAGIGQNMYTPEDLSKTAIIPGDRPYGGWLYGTLMFDAARAATNDHVEFSAGVIGHDSHASEAQVLVHRHITPTATDPKGWKTQIGEWAAFMASYERRVKLLPRRERKAGSVEWFDVSPAIKATAGNVFDNVGASTTVRFGYNLPPRFFQPIPGTPLRAQQPIPALQQAAPVPPVADEALHKTEAPEKPDWDAFVYVIANATYTLRNIFIDAEDSKYFIERVPFGREHRAGASFRVHHFRLAYQYTWRSSEFRPLISRVLQPQRPHSYGMLMVSVGPNP